MAVARRPAPTLTAKSIGLAMNAKPAAIIIANAPRVAPSTTVSKAPAASFVASTAPAAPVTDMKNFGPLGAAGSGVSGNAAASLPTNAPRMFQTITGNPVSGLSAAKVPVSNPVSGGFIPPNTPITPPVFPSPDSSGSTDSSGSSGGSGGSSGGGGGDSTAPQQQAQQQDDSDSGGGGGGGQQQQAQQQDDSGQSDDDGGDGDSSDEDSPDGDSPDGEAEGFGAEKFPRFSAYLQGDRLCAFGLVRTEFGIAPLVTVVKLPGEVTRNGPPQFGADPDIDAAMQETKARLMKGADLESIRLCSESLVRRANQGDQNARGLINRIGKNATMGNERAVHAAACVQHYVALHPNNPNQPAMFGMDAPRKTYHRGAVRLANGPMITSHRVRELAATFGGRHARHRKLILKAASQFGEERSNASIAAQLDQMERSLFELGQCIGMALGIQCVRAGGPISKLSKQAAWELGAK